METNEVTVLKAETLPEIYGEQEIRQQAEKLSQKYLQLEIGGIEDKNGYALVNEGYQVAKKLVTAIEKKRKELKADSLAYGRKVDSVADEITRLIMPIRDQLGSKLDAIDSEKERLRLEEENRMKKEEADRIEAARKAEEEKRVKIQQRREALFQTGAKITQFQERDYFVIGTTGIYNPDSIVEKYNCVIGVDILATVDDEVFNKILNSFQAESDKIAETKRLADEQARKEREELDRQKAEQARKDKELREREEKVAAEKREMEEKKRQQLIDFGKRRHELLKQYAPSNYNDEDYTQLASFADNEFQKILFTAKAKFDKEQAELKAAQEKRDRELKEKAIAEQKEKEAREQAEAEEQAAQLPDKEKYANFILQLSNLKYPEMKSKFYKSKINRIVNGIHELIEEK